MKSTGQRVYILSFFEPDPDGKIRCRVGVSGDFNVLAFERDVFGIDVEDLVECDLPAPGEPVGSADLDKILGPEEMFKLADELRSKKS